MKIRMQFVDRDGNDVTGTEETHGYVFADFFACHIGETLEMAGDLDTANEWLRSGYMGPDSCGIGVIWELEAE